MGVTNVFEIAAASPRVREFGATTGGYDLSRDLGVEMFVDFDQFVYPRGEAELAARTLGLGRAHRAFRREHDGQRERRRTARLRQAEAARKCGLRLGGGGLNPAVVEGHNVGLTPTEDEVRDAQLGARGLRERSKRSGETWIGDRGPRHRPLRSRARPRAPRLGELCAERNAREGARPSRASRKPAQIASRS